jgi:hypothetical protein
MKSLKQRAEKVLKGTSCVTSKHAETPITFSRQLHSHFFMKIFCYLEEGCVPVKNLLTYSGLYGFVSQ